MAIINIYGARSILLRFCGHQDIESEWWEKVIIVAFPIFTQLKIKVSMVLVYSSYTTWEIFSIRIYIEIDKNSLYLGLGVSYFQF